MSSKILVITQEFQKEVAETCQSYRDKDVLYVVSENNMDWISHFDESLCIFLVCKEEMQAKYFADNILEEDHNKIYCIEGYGGTHYFKNCIQTNGDTTDCICYVLKMLFENGIFNLDWMDFMYIIKGNNFRYISYTGDQEKVVKQGQVFFEENRITEYMANVFVSEEVGAYMSLISLFLEYETGIAGMTVCELEEDMKMIILYR